MKKLALTIFSLFFIMSSIPAFAVPTTLVVRARANDAKFIGTAVGGIAVAVKDFNTGKILADGMIAGGTGNTKLLMQKPLKRGEQIAGKKAASFTTTLDINKPVKLLIEISGPLSAGIDLHRESKTVWLIPGRNLDKNGIIFNLYGLMVEPSSPVPHEFHLVGDNIKIAAHISPMCGCPIRPDFLWDANKYTIRATILKNGKKISELPMTYDGTVGDFATHFVPAATGTYSIVITAADQVNNQGVAIRSAVVVNPKLFHMITGK